VNPLPAGARFPDESEHDDEVKRPAGEDVIWQVVPAKFDPEAVTAVPAGPPIEDNVKVAAPGTVKGALPISPVVPVAITVYGPLVPDATLNDPDIAPPATAHSWFEIKPLGDEEMTQPVSFVLKFVPVSKTDVPTDPEPGKIESPGVTTKLAVPLSWPDKPRRVRE
jgi:hypothetical protein